MRVALTGTPGTGKSTVAELLDTDLDVVHLNELVETERLYEDVDEQRDSKIVDVEAVREFLADREDVLIASHLAHLVPVDAVVVLRCRPRELKRRLLERDEPEDSAAENAESEALDLILSAAVERCDRVHEIDTTDRTPEAVAQEVEAVLAGRRDPGVGEVSFVDYRSLK